MKITLDDRVLESDATTLADALVEVQSASGERLIVQAEADGRPVPEDELLKPPATSPYAEELRFITADPADLVRETLGSASDIIEGLKPRQKEVADLLLDGKTDEGKELLMSLLGGWLDVNKTVQLCTSSGRVSQEAVASLDPSLEESVKRLMADLQEMRAALESGDLTSVSDLLAYEMNEQAERWGGIVASLSDSLG